MSKDWYFIPSDGTSQVDQYSDTLDQILESGIRDHVKILKPDLSLISETECIMQGKSADTYLKSHERHIICHPGTITAGNYVYDGENYWLAIGLPDDVYGVYEKCVCVLCQYYLKWQTSSGKIVGRWVNATSASKYDIGQYQSATTTTTSNNFTLLMPADEYTAELYDLRAFIDTHTPPRKVYRITRDDDILYQYGAAKGACYSFISNKEEFNPETDNPNLGICDYVPIDNNEEEGVLYRIIGDDSLSVTTSNTYTAQVTSPDGSELHPEFSWEVQCSFKEQINIEVSDQNIIIGTSDMSLIGQYINLQVIENGIVKASKTIQIQNFL